MPAQVLPTEEDFKAFGRCLVKRGYRPIHLFEVRNDIVRLGLISPRSTSGQEMGYRYDANGLTVIVWTTYVPSLGEARESDAGWVLIKEGDQVGYFSRPIHRTQNFLYRLLLTAAKARYHALYRPLCAECKAPMHIAIGKGFKARFWQCKNRASHKHKKAVNLSWDHGLPKAVLEHWKPIRKERARYLAELRAEGKQPGAAARRRRRSRVTRPGNLVTVHRYRAQ